jgi:hypothetical protein
MLGSYSGSAERISTLLAHGPVGDSDAFERCPAKSQERAMEARAVEQAFSVYRGKLLDAEPDAL